ncbi:MAG: SIR2 family protein [Oscillibacter sp.]|nr:SIR2 family protein [Oscillibacter sp.]
MDRVLFLFGNGASIYAGSQNTGSFNLSDYAEKAEYAGIKGIIQTVAGAGLCGIEEQLNALITIRSYHKIVKDTEKEGDFTKLIDEVKGDLIKNFVNSVDYRKLDYHEMFLRKLRNFGCLSRTGIYTPNYDLAFEYSLDKLGIDYNDGFSGFVNRQFDPRTLSAGNKTSLVKVHGSVNWIAEEGAIKELQPRFKDGKVEIDKTDSVLIYPTSNKLYQTYAAPYSELMRHMLNEMETGRNVVLVMGYKYGDDHINDILFKALENPENIFYFFLRSPNGGGEFVRRISELEKSMPNIHMLTGKILASFHVFVTHMLPDISAETDEEKAIKMLRKVLVNHAE